MIEDPPLEQPTIAAVHATAVVVPVTPPVETSVGDVTTAPIVLIEIEATNGCVGRSYVFCYTTRALHAVARLVGTLGEVAVGLPLSPRDVAMHLRNELRLLGAEGIAGMVLGGIDVALWDALAHAARMPLARLLGGAHRAIPAYCSLRGRSPSAVATEGDDAVCGGFRAIKIRVGHRNESQDLAAVDAAVGALNRIETSPEETSRALPAPRLMVDFNQALASLSVVDAGRRIARIVERAAGMLAWVEEPFAADDDARHAALASRIDVPVQLGENWPTPAAAHRSITAGAADLMMVDVMKIGGVTNWLPAAGLAEVYARPISSHLYPEISLHLLAASPTADTVEILDLLAPLRRDPIRVENGCASPSTMDGIGLEWDPDAVRQFAADASRSSRSESSW